MPNTYDKRELEEMTRVNLRREAVNILGIDNKECTNLRTADLIDKILEAQGGGEKKAKGNGKSNGKSRRSKREEAPKEEVKTRRSKRAEPEPPPAEVSGDLGDLVGKIDAVGKTLDENQVEAKEILEDIAERVSDIQRHTFMLFGVLADVHKSVVDGEEGFKELAAELEEDWDKECESGNGE